jgi:hypothetical protein
MKVAFNSETENQIRRTAKPGDPWALDELTAEICGDDTKLRGEFSEIVADEYRCRLSAMPRQEMHELYRRCYKQPSDANKDWLLGEIVESIEAEEN